MLIWSDGPFKISCLSGKHLFDNTSYAHWKTSNEIPEDNLEKRNSQRNFVKNRKLAGHIVVSPLLLQTATRPLSSFRLLGTDSGNIFYINRLVTREMAKGCG
jgi:hypothetical protein